MHLYANLLRSTVCKNPLIRFSLLLSVLFYAVSRWYEKHCFIIWSNLLFCLLSGTVLHEHSTPVLILYVCEEKKMIKHDLKIECEDTCFNNYVFIGLLYMRLLFMVFSEPYKVRNTSKILFLAKARVESRIRTQAWNYQNLYLSTLQSWPYRLTWKYAHLPFCQCLHIPLFVITLSWFGSAHTYTHRHIDKQYILSNTNIQ